MDTSDILILGLQKLFNKILKVGEFPSSWKIDRKVPIFKKGDKLDPNNYRPIAIHSVFRKVFCKILYDRIIKVVDIHPNQYGFIKEKRCSDHAAYVRELIHIYKKNKKLGKLFVTVFDFSKAFDSCDHNLLMKKLRKSGINGPILRIIESMYTNPQAKVFFNGQFSELFNIERGVAQGCKLSTLLFNLYINDLLKNLSAIKNDSSTNTTALCYADDLIIVTNSKKDLEKSIKILESWCGINFFDISVPKSKVLVINDKDLSEKVYIKNKEIEKVHEIKYLGFYISENGSWDSHIEKSINKVYGMMFKWKHFFQSYGLPFFIKLRLADSLILSHLRYGEEIFALNKSSESKIQAAENKVLKMIFDLPRHTCTAGILHLTGRLSVSQRLKLRRQINLCRINRGNYQNLTRLFNDKIAHKTSGTLVNKTYTDNKMLYKKSLRNYKDNIPPNLATDLSITLNKCKSILKRHFRIEENERNFRLLKTETTDIQKVNSRAFSTELLQFSDKKYRDLLTWKLGMTYYDKHRNDKTENMEDRCILCDQEIHYPLQQHLLTECSKTVNFLETYYKKLREVSEDDYNKFCKLSTNDKWVWILRSGQFCKRSKKCDFPIEEGKSISQNVDKNNLLSVKNSILQFREILDSLPSNALIIYTDGSTKDKFSGSGAILYHRGKELKRLSISLKNCDNNFAEIYAIYKALSYFKAHYAKGLKLSRKIHVFTDSQNTIDMLTFFSSPHRYSRIIDRILDMISTNNSPTLTLHWIPSHISYIENNIRNSIIGNEIADKLAGEAAESGYNIIDVKKDFYDIPKKLLSISADLVSAIENSTFYKVTESYDSNINGPSSDDFSLTDASQIASMHSVTS